MARRISVTPSRMVVSTQTTRGSLTTLSLKAPQGPGPFVGIVLRGQDAAALQRVVDDDQAVRGQLGQHRLVVGVVGDLVGVNEDQVERPLQLLQGAQRRPLDHADVALEPGLGNVAPGHLGVVRVDLERNDGPVLAQPRRHGDGRVAGEGADLEDAGRLGGEDEQLEETALLAPDHHPPGGKAVPGGGVHRLEVPRGRRRVRVGVRLDLGIDQLGHVHFPRYHVSQRLGLPNLGPSPGLASRTRSAVAKRVRRSARYPAREAALNLGPTRPIERTVSNVRFLLASVRPSGACSFCAPRK